MRFHWDGYFYMMQNRDALKWKLAKKNGGFATRTGKPETITEKEFLEAYQKYLANERAIDELIRNGNAITM